MKNCDSANDVDGVVKDYSGNGIKEDDFADEFLSHLPSMAKSSASYGSSPYASLQFLSKSKFDYHYDHDAAHAGSFGGTKKLEHAPPSEPMHSPGFGMFDSRERPPVVFASSHNVAPGAFPVRSVRHTSTRRTFRSPMTLYDSPREFTNEESKREDGLSNPAGAYPGAHDSSHVANESCLYAVEAQWVPDGNEEGSVMVAEAQYIRMYWYQRRWIVTGLALFACGLILAVVVVVVRQPAGASSSSLSSPTTTPMTWAPTTPEPIAAPLSTAPITGGPTTPDPTLAPLSTAPITGAPTSPDPTAAPLSTAPITGAPTSPDPTAAPPTSKPSTAPPTRAPITRRPTTTSKPTSLTPEEIACNFLSIPNVTKCRSTFEFYDTTTGSKIPSAIGLLTQLTWLDLSKNSLTSSFPSEIGLLTQLTQLSFWQNALTSTIPSAIGLLTQLTYLAFFGNSLTSTIPSEIRLMTKLTYLNVGENSLTSIIPSEIGFLTLLTLLSFYRNELTSTIPSEIGLLTQLTELYFSDNALTSTVPSAIGRLALLRRMDLFGNSLKGIIPSSLCSLPSLKGNIGIECGEIACASGCCYCW